MAQPINQEVSWLAANRDIHLGNIRGWIENGTSKDSSGNIVPKNYAQIAQDAALSTLPNSVIPALLLSYWDPKAIDILTKKRSARDMFKEVKKGTFASATINFRTQEFTGNTVPYSDYGNSGQASTNYNWPQRDVYRFQTNINVGDLEAEMSGEAKIALVADRQRAAATMLDIDANRFYLLGVAGKQIFGILNDPSLPAVITPISVSGQTSWVNKTTVQRYNDVLALFEELVSNMGGHVDASTSLVLALSPSLNVMLAAATEFNVSVLDMLKKYFTSLRIVTVPELLAPDGTQTMCLYPEEVLGQATGECVAPEKFRACPVFRKESSITQKVAAATAGAVIYRPLAFVRMNGM